MQQFVFASTFLTLGLAATVAADDAVTFKLAQPKPEDRVRVSQSEKTKLTRTTTINGKKSIVTDQNATAWVYVGEVVAKGKDDEPKMTRTYLKYQVVNNGKLEQGPPLKVPITIEKKGDAFAFAAGKRQLPPEFVKRLEAEFSPATKGVAPVDMLPDKPIKVGGSWMIDATKAFQGTGQVMLDADRGTMTGKLVKTYQKDSRQFALLEFIASAPIKSLGPNVALMPKDGSVAELRLTVDACIDGTEPYSRTAGSTIFRVEADIPGGAIQLVSETHKTESIELVPKK